MSQRDRGIFLMDAVVGLAIIGALATTVTVSINYQRKNAQTLEHHRRLDRLAQGVLTDLRAGRTPGEPYTDGLFDPDYQVTRLDDTPPGPGWVWVRVTAENGDMETDLVGIVPEGSLSIIEVSP
jgi:hypothetical protein